MESANYLNVFPNKNKNIPIIIEIPTLMTKYDTGKIGSFHVRSNVKVNLINCEDNF